VAPILGKKAGLIFVFGSGGATERHLKCGNCIGVNRRTSATLNCEPKRAIEWRKLVLAETPRLSFTQTDPGHPDPALHFIVERHSVSSQMQSGGKRFQSFSHLVVDELARFETEPGYEKPFPARHSFELTHNFASDLFGRKTRHRPPRPPPQLIDLAQGSPEPVLVGMNCLAQDQRISQYPPCGFLEFPRDLTGAGLSLGLEVEAEVAAPPLDHETLMLAGAAEDHLWRPHRCIPAYQIVG
jgi:hypothetical protein